MSINVTDVFAGNWVIDVDCLAVEERRWTERVVKRTEETDPPSPRLRGTRETDEAKDPRCDECRDWLEEEDVDRTEEDGATVGRMRTEELKEEMAEDAIERWPPPPPPPPEPLPIPVAA